MISNFGLDDELYTTFNEERAVYLSNNSGILEKLKQYNIYVKPTSYEDKLYLLSFSASYDIDDMIIDGTKIVVSSQSNLTDENGDSISGEYYHFSNFEVGGLKFSRDVAYPILSVRKEDTKIEDNNLNVEDVFSEWIDYIFDYEKNELIFKTTTFDDITSGHLYVEYNPIFISRLTREEVGRHADEESDADVIEDKLILDYFKETIEVNSSHIASRSVPLRAKPTDPIREVLLYKTTEDEPINLFEDYHYTVDDSFNTPKLIFEPNVISGSTAKINEYDILEIVYTPNLDDNTIYLGYYAKRNDVNKQCYIEDYYIEYKV